MANSEVFVITRSLLGVRCLVTAFRWRAWLQGGGNPGELGGARTKSGDRRPRRGNRAEVPVAPHSKVLLGCLALILLLGFASAPAHAQTSKDPQKSQDDDEVVRVKSNLVNIDVMVKDKKGKYISDLRAEDFTIFENGVQQKMEFFDAPLAGTDGRSKNGRRSSAGVVRIREREELRIAGAGFANHRHNKFEASARRDHQVRSGANNRGRYGGIVLGDERFATAAAIYSR